MFEVCVLNQDDIAGRGRETAASRGSLINNPIDHVRKALLEHNPRSVLRAIIYYNDLSTLKWCVANCLHDLFDGVLFHGNMG